MGTITISCQTLAGGGTVVRALAFSEKWQSEAYAFGYVRAAAEASQSATMKGVTAGSEGGIQYGKSSGSGTQTDSETLNYCADAYFKVRSGGLMQPSVTLYFESGTGYGHCWSMEVKTIDGDEFRKPVPFPVIDYQFDLVLGQD